MKSFAVSFCGYPEKVFEGETESDAVDEYFRDLGMFNTAPKYAVIPGEKDEQGRPKNNGGWKSRDVTPVQAVEPKKA